MFFSPRFIALVLAILITTISLTFLNFVAGINNNILFIAGISTFSSSFFFVFFVIDMLIFREIENIYQTIKQVKIKDFDTAKKNLINHSNPIKKLNEDFFGYASKKQEEIEELKRAEQFRREFLADVSHELKTPIFAAQGFIHTLLDGAKDDLLVRDRFLTKAAKSLDGLDALVRDLVALSQLESGEIRMNFEPVNIHTLITEIFEQLESKAATQNIRFKLKPKPEKPIFVWADKQRLQQVMTNLIDNAIKYGKEYGKIKVIIETIENETEIKIQDDGLGIADEHLHRIFERFYRIDKSRSKETGGTGLGLAIVKHILNAHNSTISVKSKLHKGSEFMFKLQNNGATV